ncbi:MAG: TlpA family protein disulfide reductase [Spirochaetales bacterium]|nr:TlpA family protein disulfide reductase [Spirochaetales bacterium]
MNAIQKSSLLLFMILLAFPSFARGGDEADSSSDIIQSTEVLVPDPETTDEGTQTDVNADVEPTILDAQTADVLFGLGMMPFQNRIPSEDFVLATLEGDEQALADYHGKVVFLNFWATWCPPCREEMPSMQTLYDELSDDGLEIVAVNVLEAEDTVSAFVEENGFTYPVLLDRDGRVSLRYSVRAYPTTYILDRAGNVIAVRQGFHNWSTPEMIAGFRKLLER